jgi:hypothetical protein
MTAEDLPGLDNECFFIAPIGSEGSDTRERSDGVLEYIVAPAAADVGSRLSAPTRSRSRARSHDR